MAQRPRWLFLSSLLAVSLLALSLAGSWGCRSEPEPPAGDIVADLTLPALDGSTFDPSVLRGKKVIVNFWSPG